MPDKIHENHDFEIETTAARSEEGGDTRQPAAGTIASTRSHGATGTDHGLCRIFICFI